MATLHDRIPHGGNRAIVFAILVSLALHLTLLPLLPTLREAQQRRSEPILARLTEPRPKRVADPVPAAFPAESARATPPQSAPKRAQPPRAKPAAPVVPAAAPSSPPVLARTETGESAPSMPVSLAPPTLAAAPTPQPALPASEALDPGTLAQYRLSVISAARRFKRYPRVALDQNWQGRAEIRMVVAPSGEISALNVRSSAGHRVLDEHALEMIERAQAMAPIPPALRGKEFSVDIPVVFSLRDAGA